MAKEKIDAYLNNAAGEFDMVVRVVKEGDIAVARHMVKQLAQETGFSLADTAKIATAVSELARNIYRYAREGRILTRRRQEDKNNLCLEVIAVDRGPGIPDVELVMTRGYTTYERSLGIGLPGVKRLMDAFEIYSVAGYGTVVIAEKRRRKI